MDDMDRPIITVVLCFLIVIIGLAWMLGASQAQELSCSDSVEAEMVILGYENVTQYWSTLEEKQYLWDTYPLGYMRMYAGEYVDVLGYRSRFAYSYASDYKLLFLDWQEAWESEDGYPHSLCGVWVIEDKS